MILDDGISVERKYKQQGNMTEARDVLRSILAIDNRHEDTWLLFSKVAESNKNAVYCLSQVLKINLSKQKQQPDQPPYLPSPSGDRGHPLGKYERAIPVRQRRDVL
jgi:hypothetical protein